MEEESWEGDFVFCLIRGASSSGGGEILDGGCKSAGVDVNGRKESLLLEV